MNVLQCAVVVFGIRWLDFIPADLVFPIVRQHVLEIVCDR